MLAPIIIFVYNRPEHTKLTIEALANNILADQSDLYIFSDNAKNEKSIENVKLVREYISNLTNLRLFKNVFVEMSDINKGLANSVIYGVTKILNKYGKAIVLEDDLVTSIDFISFMNDSLDFFEFDERIWSISGYNLPINIPNYYKYDIYLSFRACSWGWATWLNRWATIDWEVKDFIKFSKNIFKQNKFNRGGRDLSIMLEQQMNGKIDSWAIRWCYSQSVQDKLTIYPTESRVKNIGLDGSGTHSGVSNRYDSQIVIETNSYKLSNVKLNKRILKNFKNYYLSLFKYILMRTKRYIIKLF